MLGFFHDFIPSNSLHGLLYCTEILNCVEVKYSKFVCLRVPWRFFCSLVFCTLECYPNTGFQTLVLVAF